MGAHKRGAVIAVGLALPFVGIATYFWLRALGEGIHSARAIELFFVGDFIYALGFPLTYIMLILPVDAGRVLSPSDYWWAIPSIDALFIVQWIIWSQLIVLLIRVSPKENYEKGVVIGPASVLRNSSQENLEYMGITERARQKNVSAANDHNTNAVTITNYPGRTVEAPDGRPRDLFEFRGIQG